MAIETITSMNAFKELVRKIKWGEGYREPIAFGIARVDRGQINVEKVLHANFLIINWNENFRTNLEVINWKKDFGCAAVFVRALQETGIVVDFSGSEFVATLNNNFGIKHKNRDLKTLFFIVK